MDYIQFFIKLVTSHIIHYTQGLTLEHLVFDSFSAKHGFTYTTLSCNYSKKHLYLLSPMSNKNFNIAFIIEKEMSIINNNTIQIKHSFYEIILVFLLLIQFYIFIC